MAITSFQLPNSAASVYLAPQWIAQGNPRATTAIQYSIAVATSSQRAERITVPADTPQGQQKNLHPTQGRRPQTSAVPPRFDGSRMLPPSFRANGRTRRRLRRN